MDTLSSIFIDNDKRRGNIDIPVSCIWEWIGTVEGQLNSWNLLEYFFCIKLAKEHKYRFYRLSNNPILFLVKYDVLFVHLYGMMVNQRLG